LAPPPPATIPLSASLVAVLSFGSAERVAALWMARLLTDPTAPVPAPTLLRRISFHEIAERNRIVARPPRRSTAFERSLGTARHPLVSGIGIPAPKDYMVAAHVDPKVSDDLATWILALSK
jgi:hypothetical protein